MNKGPQALFLKPWVMALAAGAAALIFLFWGTGQTAPGGAGAAEASLACASSVKQQSASLQAAQARTQVCVLQAQLEKQTADMPPMQARHVGVFNCAANCCERYPHICGGTGVTASGAPQTAGVTAGANLEVLPIGTWIYIEDIGIRQVQDTGPACPANHLDIAVNTHAEALAWAQQGSHRVWILN